MRRKRRKRQRKIILGIFIALICLMSISYAAFNTNLTLNAKGNLKQIPITIEQLKEKVNTEDDGLYKDPNPEEPNRYVYAGAEPKNYITFNNEHAGWRIISIE